MTASATNALMPPGRRPGWTSNRRNRKRGARLGRVEQQGTWGSPSGSDPAFPAPRATRRSPGSRKPHTGVTGAWRERTVGRRWRSRPSSRRCSRRSSRRRSTTPGWLFEVKWDGFRAEAVVDGGRVQLFTRGGLDAAQSYFGPFLDPPTWIDARDAVVDGEVIALDAHGEPDFALLQARIKGRGLAAEPNPFVYEVFDLLHLDGRSLLDEPLEERRRLLASVLRADPRVRLSEHIEADGMAFFEAARARGLEGIMAKDRRSPYLPGQAQPDLAEGQDPPGAGAGRGRVGDRDGQGGGPRRAARRRLRGRRAPLRGQDRRRLHQRRPARTCWRRSPGSRRRRRRSSPRSRRRPRRTRAGSARSS